MLNQDNKKYHLFIDESGDTSLSSINPTFPIFVLLGCLMKDEYFPIQE